MGFSQFNNTANMYYYRHEWKALLYSFGLLKDILGVGGLILLAAGIIYLLIDKKYALLSFLSILFFSLFIYYGSVSMTEHRYMLLAIIPLLIMQGYFISKAIVIKRLRMLFVVVLFILIAVNFIDAYPMIKFRHDYSLQEEFAKFVKDNTEPQAYIIAMDEGPFIEYYAQRNVLYKATGIHREDFEQFFNRVDSLLMNEAQIYIISSGIYGYDPRKYFIDMLFDKYNLIYIGGSLNEDYHHKAIKQLLFLEELYKIEKKT